MPDNPNHIVFLTPGFAESESDSTTIPALQIYLKELSSRLSDTKLTLISFQFPFHSKPYPWNGITVIPLNGQNSRLKKYKTWTKARETLEKLHQRHKIDVIHSFWIGECTRIGSLFSKGLGIKHVVSLQMEF